ncbi:hypothetical protein BIW11_05743 [Tropilaelaps mercedesae]|uniref:Uncharacterized protein n=1 Tax=Tropilaelaps mercedesae TaxID=418985 RepID=A0A1V9Y149_9ACAR|nr:hypothetical protein BIW11_05743 [Tropilaelaps mercedesae]
MEQKAMRLYIDKNRHFKMEEEREGISASMDVPNGHAFDCRVSQRASTLTACWCLLLAVVALQAEPTNAQRSRAGAKKAVTEAPTYDDYEEYDQGSDETDKAGDDSKTVAGKNSAAPSSSTAAPDDAEDDDSKGTHSFFKNRLRLRTRPSPHPAVKAKPTLPSFIKHPANIEDLGHEHRSEPKPTQPPLPRPKPTTAKPHRFSSGTLRKKQTPPPAKEEPKDDYEDEEDEPAEKRPAASPAKKPLRPRRV